MPQLLGMDQADIREEQQPSHTEVTMGKYTVYLMYLVRGGCGQGGLHRGRTRDDMLPVRTVETCMLHHKRFLCVLLGQISDEIL